MRGWLFVQGMVACVALSAVTYGDRIQRLRAAIEKALRIAGLSDEAAAITMEMDPSHWSKQRPTGGVTGRLVALPPEFWRELFPELGQIVNVPVRVGPPEPDRIAQVLDRLDQIERRVLKAELRCESDDTSSSAA
jgi:hypothetical protein